jgi:hypothetical protein
MRVATQRAGLSRVTHKFRMLNSVASGVRCAFERGRMRLRRRRVMSVVLATRQVFPV